MYKRARVGIEASATCAAGGAEDGQASKGDAW
jgi:hypothetical protein